MQNWMIQCDACKLKFAHSMIPDLGRLNLLQPAKPRLPLDGDECECPQCGHIAKYKRTDLQCSQPYQLVSELDN